MAGTLQKVRIIVACAYGDVGTELTPNGTLRDWLVGNGYAEIVGPAREVEARPAKMSSRAARKIADGVKSLIPG